MAFDTEEFYVKSEEEMREIFLNMDRAMKYIHDHGYCVKSFDPRNIMILNNSINQIKLDTVALPDDYAEKKQYIKEDIYNSSFIFKISLRTTKPIPIAYAKNFMAKSNNVFFPSRLLKEQINCSVRQICPAPKSKETINLVIFITPKYQQFCK